MDNIKMVDLYRQYANIKEEVDSAIDGVIKSTAFINGPHVKSFARNLSSYLDVEHCMPCANGTDALQIALMALELQPGDEVIVPNFTFIATAEVIALLRLKPVMIDVDPSNFNIDTDRLDGLITDKTKAIIPVHLYGQCANMREIKKVATHHDIYVIEDAAQALGAYYDDGQLSGKAGTLGHIGCTSFFPSKNLGCFGDGGAIFTNDTHLAEKIACITNHGAKVKYYHDEVGVNSRLDTLQAAILDVKLKYLDGYCTARQKAASYYDSRLSQIEQLSVPDREEYTSHVFHQYTLKVGDGKRDELQKFLKEAKIPSMIYYPVPMHRQKAFKAEGEFPVSEELCKSVLSLPIHTELTVEELDYICTQIELFYKK